MILEKFIKQPQERKDYDVDYRPWFDGMDTDSLDEVTGTVVCLTDPSDTSLVLEDIIFTTYRAKAWMHGGTAGNKYKLTLLATTVVGRIDESELIFTIKDY